MGERVDAVAKIAVLRANALGDYLFCLPALHALRHAYPDAEVVLLGAPWHARALSGRPGPVARVVTVPALPGIRAADAADPVPAAAAPAFVDRMVAESFDLALQLHGGGRHSNPLVTALRARVTAGLRAEDAPPLDRWLRYVHYQPAVFRHLEVVGLVGASPVGWQPTFEVTEADLAEARRVAGPPAGPRIAVHPGAMDARRRWPAERFAEVADVLADAGAEVLVTGTPPERDVVERVRARMRHPGRTLVGALSVGGLAGLYAGCSVVVANDTGPLHLAAAVGAPTVGIYWAGNLVNAAPVYREHHRPVASWTQRCPECGADCMAELYPGRTGTPCHHRPSLVTDVPVAEVMQQALDLFGRRRSRRRDAALAGGPAAG